MYGDGTRSLKILPRGVHTSIKLDASNETPQGTPEEDAAISMLMLAIETLSIPSASRKTDFEPNAESKAEQTIECKPESLHVKKTHIKGFDTTYLAATRLSFGLIDIVQLLLTTVEDNYLELSNINFKLPNTFLTTVNDFYEAELHWPMLERKAKAALCKSTPPYMGCCVAVLSHVHRGLRRSGSSKGHVPQSQLNGLWLALLSR